MGMRITQIIVKLIISINEPLRASLVDIRRAPVIYPAHSTIAPIKMPK